jgi:uncharacterized coiled-coil protein SlyX
MILDSPIITGSLLQQAGQFAEIPRYTEVSSSLLSVSASLNAKINALNTDTGSQASRLSNLETKSGSVDTSITNLNTFTQSFSQSVATSFSSSNASITSLSASVASVTGDFSSSVATSFSQSNSALTTLSASVSTSFSQSNASITSLSASVASVTGDFSSSVATSFSQSNATITSLSSSANTRISGLASFTGSYATTGSNTFTGTQTISGSTYIQGDLIVLGTSSMQNITGSSVNIGTNTIVVNTSNPAVRFGGISVQDSGSGAGASGSLFWDSLNNNWLYQNPTGLTYTSAKLISGPQNTGSLGNEQGLTIGKIVLAVGDDHIGDSIMTQTTGKITLSGDLDVTGNISSSTLSGIGNITNFSQSVSTIFAGLSNATSSYETTGRGIISGSAQLPTGVISGSSQLTSSYDTRYVASGSITQTTWDNIASKPGGIISGSEQTTGSLDLRYRLIGNPVTFSELTGKPTLISSSLQFTTLTDAFTGSFTGSFKGDGSLLTGLTAGGKIHTQTTPSSTWTFIHNLNAQYPNVTVYSTAGQVVLPQSITATDSNTLVLEFGTTVAGYATAGIGGIIEVQGRTVKQNFTSSLSWRFEHNFGDRFVNIQTFDSNYEKIIPQTIVLTDNTSSLITFPEAESGWAVGTIGGDLPAISSAESGYVLQVSNTSPYTASWTPVANVTVTNALTASHLNPISQSLVPAISGTYDLGSQNKPWRHIYVGTGSIFLVDDKAQTTRTISAQTIVTTDTLNSGSISLINSLPTGTVSGSLQVVDILTSLNTATASFSPRILNLESKSASVDISITNINSVTASNIARLSNLETKSASVDISITNINSITASNIARLSNLETKSASVDISITNINSITASNIARLTNIENRTGSFATTGSNTFFGTQVFSGSVFIATDLIVQGSSSIQYISASSVSIGTNIVQLNTATPSVRFAGMSVQDSGSSAGVTGSMLWDSLCNRWIYSNPSGVGYSGGMLLSGPRASTLGSETTLTCNYIAKSGGGDHLYDSCIIDDGTTVCVNATLKASGQVCGIMSNFSCIGIGTTTPTKVLHVYSSACDNNSQVSIGDQGSITRLYLGTNGGAAYISLGGTYTNGNYTFDGTNAMSQISMQGYNGGSLINFSTTTCNSVYPSTRMIITPDGNVGLGIFTPTSKLMVTKGVQCGCIGKVSDTAIQIDGEDYGAGTYSAQIGFGYPNYGMTYNPVAIAYLPQTGVGSGNADLAFYTRTATTDTAPSQRMRISSTGVTSFTCQICVAGTTLPNDLFALNFLTMGG